jgi:hypothetical protein
VKKFFDEYPKFYETSQTTANSNRLNFRYHTIIEQNVELLKGKKVVEIAMHDGRWAFAALRGGGAKFVRGVEPRKHLVENGRRTVQEYGVSKKEFDFIVGDGFDEAERMVREGEKYDTAMVLGFLYHTARQYELINKLSKLDISSIIIDTAVLKDVTGPYIRVGLEGTRPEAQLHSGDKPFDLGGVASITAFNLMLKAAGFQPYTIVPTIPVPTNGAGDYREGKRFTIIGRR